LVAVAEEEADRGVVAGGRAGGGVEAAPVADDLVERVDLVPTPVAEAPDVLPPVLGGSGVLLAVGEDLRQRVECVLGPRVVALAQRLEQLDEVELVGELEPLDARGEARDRLVFAERADRESAGLVGAAVIRLTPALLQIPEPVAVLRH